MMTDVEAFFRGTLCPNVSLFFHELQTKLGVVVKTLMQLTYSDVGLHFLFVLLDRLGVSIITVTSVLAVSVCCFTCCKTRLRVTDVMNTLMQPMCNSVGLCLFFFTCHF